MKTRIRHWALIPLLVGMPAASAAPILDLESAAGPVRSMVPSRTNSELVSEWGTRVILGGEGGPMIENGSIITPNAQSPRISLGEDGSYWAACRSSGINRGVEIYHNTGDPAYTAWVNTVNLYNLASLLYHDIEVVTSADRCFVVYQITDEEVVECFWFQISNPSNYGFATLGTMTSSGEGVSITSSEVEFDGDEVDLFASWKHTSGIVTLSTTRSVNLGSSWDDVATHPFVVGTMYNGDAIAYCPGDNHVFITYTNNASGDVYVAASDNAFAEGGGYTQTNVMSSSYGLTAGGIASMFGNYILVAAHGETAVSGQNIWWVYSTNSGFSWSTATAFNTPGDQLYPSCAANDDGKFSILYYDDSGTMNSKTATYTDLSGSGWVTWLVDEIDPRRNSSSAVMEDGLYSPRHGGAWGSPGSYFSWNGSSSQGMRVDVQSHADPDPVLIPSSGGTFPYRVTVENTGTSSVSFYGSIEITWPDQSTYGPILGPIPVTAAPGWSYSRVFTFDVPDTWPEGDYSLNALIESGGVVLTSDSFLFRKMAPL